MKAAACSCSQRRSCEQPCSLTIARTSCTGPGTSQAGVHRQHACFLPDIFLLPHLLPEQPGRQL